MEKTKIKTQNAKVLRYPCISFFFKNNLLLFYIHSKDLLFVWLVDKDVARSHFYLHNNWPFLKTWHHASCCSARQLLLLHAGIVKNLEQSHLSLTTAWLLFLSLTLLISALFPLILLISSEKSFSSDSVDVCVIHHISRFRRSSRALNMWTLTQFAHVYCSNVK